MKSRIIGEPSYKASQETRELLIQKFELALAAVDWNGGSADEPSQQPSEPGFAIRMPDSPLSECSRCEDSNRDLRDQDQNNAFKKRKKTLSIWTELIEVFSVMEVERPLDDGYSWRKYGQKEILGAKYPRGYYRCTHRYDQGCQATKQVQRCDEDPSVFEITYRGMHTCTMASNVVPPSGSGPQENQQSNLNPFEPIRAASELRCPNMDTVEVQESSGWYEIENLAKKLSAGKEKASEFNVSPHNNSESTWPLFTDTSEEKDKVASSESKSHEYSGPSCSHFTTPSCHN